MTPESAIANPAGITAGGPPHAVGTALGAGSVAALAVATHTRPMWSEAFPMKTEALATKTEVFAIKAGKTGEISLWGAIAARRCFDRCQNRATAAWAFAGFTLVEVLVVVSLLSLIVLALMAVFSSTQRAFRASVTQTDVLGGGRAAVDLIASDVRTMTPSDWYSNGVYTAGVFQPQCPVNFSVAANYNYYLPLNQTLPPAPPGSTVRTNLLNYFFMLSRENTKWIGIGYVVDNTNSTTLFPLYRYYAETNTAYSPQPLYNQFVNFVTAGQWTNMNRVLDGVVHFTVRAYDPNGNWINNATWPYYYTNAANTVIMSPAYGEARLYMLSNAVPAAVEIDLGVLEDRPLAHAEALSVPGQAPSQVPALWRYLQGQSGAVHLFRQRVSIPNVDTSAYQ